MYFLPLCSGLVYHGYTNALGVRTRLKYFPSPRIQCCHHQSERNLPTSNENTQSMVMTMWKNSVL